jgi:hypothetical protein
MFQTQGFVVPIQGTAVWEKRSVTVFITVSWSTTPYILVLRDQHFGIFTLKMAVVDFSAVSLPVYHIVWLANPECASLHSNERTAGARCSVKNWYINTKFSTEKHNIFFITLYTSTFHHFDKLLHNGSSFTCVVFAQQHICFFKELAFPLSALPGYFYHMRRELT